MVHSLIPDSVRIKVTNFEKPARLINCMELTAAVGMAYRQARLPMPEAEAGMSLKEVRNRSLKELEAGSGADEKLLTVIRDYIFKAGETVDEDAVVTMKLGYDFREF